MLGLGWIELREKRAPCRNNRLAWLTVPRAGWILHSRRRSVHIEEEFEVKHVSQSGNGDRRSHKVARSGDRATITVVPMRRPDRVFSSATRGICLFGLDCLDDLSLAVEPANSHRTGGG